MIRFNVTYEIITEESAKDSDAEEIGFVIENCRLRYAIEYLMGTRTPDVSGAYGTEWNGADMRWLTVYNDAEYETGATESRSLHIPEHVTASSRKRIGRLVGVRKPAKE